MGPSLDDRTVRSKSCSSCGERFQHVTGFVSLDGEPHAVYFAACHGEPESEVQIDVVLGTWGVEPPVDDHQTFSYRLGADGAVAADATLAVTSDAPVGRRLSRAEALAHPWMRSSRDVIEFLADSDPTIRDTVSG